MQYFKFYIIALFFVLSSSIYAQEKKVSMALTATPTLGWMTPANDGYSQDGVKMGFKYGLLMDFRLFGEDNYSLASGFTMNHTGGKLIEPGVIDNNGTLTPAKVNANYQLTYVDIPLTIRLKTKEIGYNVYYGHFGSELGFNVNAKKTFTTYNSSTTLPESTLDVGQDVNLFRSSLVFGIGVQRNISGNTHYRIGLTFHNGLTNVTKGKAYNVDSNGNTLVDENALNDDSRRDLSNKLKFIALDLAIVF